MGNNIKDINTLISERLKEIDDFKSTLNFNPILVFNIGNTSSVEHQNFYFTPIRLTKNYLVTGSVVFDSDTVIALLRALKNKFNYFFIDIECKSPFTKELSLENLAIQELPKCKIKWYKGNDITVDSIDSLVCNYFESLSQVPNGKNVLIIGMGNIGFKIALKLLERGCNINIYGRNDLKNKNISNVLNSIKPKYNKAKVEIINPNILSKRIDLLILTHLKPLNSLDSFYEKNISKELLLIDVGKGCLTNSQFEKVKIKGSSMSRLDIGDSLLNFIDLEISKNKGKINFDQKINFRGFNFIQRGTIGDKNDVVVDSLEEPKIFYGICDGEGGFKTFLSDLEINIVKQFINDDNTYNRN